MITQTVRDPWRVAWQIATSDYVIAILLLGIAAGLVITAWLPQMPVADPVAYARWLSETQGRFGNATTAIQALGLLTVTRSLGFRALLALLTGSLLLRLIEGGDRLRRHRETTEPAGEWYTLTDVRLSEATDDLRRRRYRVLGEHPLFQADRWPWGNLFPLLAHGGGLLLLIGLFVTHLWGWRIEGVVIQGSERVTLPDTGTWVKWDESTHDVTHSPGIMALIEEQLPGIQVRADDGAGQPLSLQQTPNAEPVTRLTVALAARACPVVPQPSRAIGHRNRSGGRGQAAGGRRNAGTHQRVLCTTDRYLQPWPVAHRRRHPTSKRGAARKHGVARTSAVAARGIRTDRNYG